MLVEINKEKEKKRKPSLFFGLPEHFNYSEALRDLRNRTIPEGQPLCIVYPKQDSLEIVRQLDKILHHRATLSNKQGFKN